MKAFFRSQFFLMVCILAGIAVLIGLGTWQLNRLTWKEGLIVRVEDGLKQSPLPIDEVVKSLQQGDDIEYRPASARGRFHHDKEQHYFATHKGRAGYFVYTPLEAENGDLLFVNRGFVPMPMKEAELRKEGQIAGIITINGLARSVPNDKPNSFVPDNDPASNIYYWKSLSAMQANAFPDGDVKMLPLFLDADNSANPGGLPEGGVTLISFPNNHLQYALTWLGLAFALLMVGGYFFVSRR